MPTKYKANKPVRKPHNLNAIIDAIAPYSVIRLESGIYQCSRTVKLKQGVVLYGAPGFKTVVHAEKGRRVFEGAEGSAVVGLSVVNASPK